MDVTRRTTEYIPQYERAVMDSLPYGVILSDALSTYTSIDGVASQRYRHPRLYCSHALH
jgi:hypothetical protein